MASVALLIWPIIALIIFSRIPFSNAIVIASILPYLFLPEAFIIPIPALPDLSKTASISLGLIGGYLFFGPSRSINSNFRNDSPIIGNVAKLLLFFVIFGFTLTVLNNREPLEFGPIRLPGLESWDVIGMTGEFIIAIAPFILAWRFMSSPDTHRFFLKALVYWALIYSLFMIIEIRLSPQLHNWVYGYHQHSFLQHIRDGFRPKVFLQHGIWVGFFIFMSLLSAVGLSKSEKRGGWLLATMWLFFILLISENLGAFIIGVIFVAIFVFLFQRIQIITVATIALCVLTYPYLRQAEIIPTSTIVQLSGLISEERAASLQFRINHENHLLERAAIKPWTGWGSWGRERNYDEYGRDLTVSDGLWILVLGQNGWIGYIARFGLLTLPLLTLWGTYRRRKSVPVETMALALICTGNLVYMIPNATLTVLGLLAFGALTGYAQFEPGTNEEKSDSIRFRNARSQHRYTRFPVNNDLNREK